MFSLPPEELHFLPEHQQVLRNLTIDETHPGTILHDFDAMLNFLRERPLPLTAGRQLPLRALSEINSRLAHPLQLGLKRPQQKSYAHIHGLYLLVRASGLTYVDETGKKPALVVDEKVYQSWIGLNPTERYSALLEAWLIRGHPEIIGERGFGVWLIPENFRQSTSFYTRIPGEGVAVAGDRDIEDWLKYSPGWHNLGLLELFGLVRIQHGAPEPGQGWRIDRIQRVPVGDALLAALYSGFFEDLGNIFELEEAEEISPGVLQPTLQPYFPEWKNNLSIPKWAFRDGTYVFKVSLGPVWSRIAIGAKRSLDDLASVILASVEFDSDHLYQFSYQTRFGFPQEINHPYLDEGPFTSEVLIGDIPLRVGQTMTYLFDFGDNWEFDVTLERVDPEGANKKTRILETHGEAPEQYPSWDWDDEDEEEY